MINTLVVGDLHLPYELEGYLEFCKRIEKAFRCNRVIFIGDLIDNHSISYHEHNPNGKSPKDEMSECDKHLKHWFKAFPSVFMCKGNHDCLMERRANTFGLPDRLFRTFEDIWNLPKTWRVAYEWRFEDVLFSHGTGYGGKYANAKAAHNARCSAVIGHLHTLAGVDWSANSKDTIFGMSVGCGIDIKKYTFAYQMNFPQKPILGCGLVSSTKHGVNAQFIPMEVK